LRHEIGEALEAGTAVIVSVVYRNGRASVESTLDRADTITELRMDRATINSLDEAVAEAMLSTGTTGTSS
jgi:hypothetical protein